MARYNPLHTTLVVPGALGVDVGAGSDGVLIGALTPAALSYGALKGHAKALLCVTDDGGLFVNETTPMANATADDVEVLPATPADDDAIYFGCASATFARVDVNITTQGVGTWTMTYYYWDGAAWTALAAVVDDTTGWTAATGYKSITYTLPSGPATPSRSFNGPRMAPRNSLTRISY